VLAPAAVLASWSERATARSVATGATVGLGAFIGLTLAGAADPVDGWVSTATSAPAVLAVPAHLLAAWLVRSRDMPTSRHPLSAGLEGLSATVPAGSRGG
jgi:Na+(H+)/acetate symporter ActP